MGDTIGGMRGKFMRDVWGSRVSRNYKTIRTYITEVIVNRDQSDDNECETCGPFEQDKKDQDTIGWRSNNGIELRTWRGG